METDAPAILIVDDNEDNRYTLQLLLEADGHTRLATASGGHEALALLARDKFSLVLLDMMMHHQGESGYERCFGRGLERRHGYRAGLKMHRDRRRRLFAEAFQSNHSSCPHLIRVAQAFPAVDGK